VSTSGSWSGKCAYVFEAGGEKASFGLIFKDPFFRKRRSSPLWKEGGKELFHPQYDTGGNQSVVIRVFSGVEVAAAAT